MNNIDYIFNNYSFEAKCPLRISDFGRDDLAELLCDFDFRIGAEIGVYQGDYSEVLLSKNPELKLYLIDPWLALPGMKLKRGDETVEAEQWIMDKIYEFTVDRFKGKNVRIIRKFSTEAVNDFADNALDFVYIDGDHSLVSCVLDIACWSRKVKKGGIISGHDYRDFETINTCQVKQAVDAYTDANKINPWFIFGKQEDAADSWMWING